MPEEYAGASIDARGDGLEDAMERQHMVQEMEQNRCS